MSARNSVGMMLFVWGLVFLSSAGCDELFRIPIGRHKSGMERMLEVNTHPDDLMKVFGRKEYSGSSSFGPKPHENDTIQIFKMMQSQFFGKIGIGHPAQTFKMALDTTYYHSWITSTLCSPFQFPPCALRHKYDSTISSTYTKVGKSYTINTNKGSLFGFVSQDKVHLGHINVVNQTFAEIEGVSLMQLLYTSYDGVLGLGYRYTSGEAIVPVVLNIMAQKLIPKPILSFYFNREPSTEKGGSLLLGGVDPKHTDGNFIYLKSNPDWYFKVDKIFSVYRSSFLNYTVTVCQGGCQAFPSTSDVLISGPREDIKELNRLLGANYLPYLDRYEVSCEKVSKFPLITIVLGERNFTMHGKDYVQKVMYGPFTLCLSAFAELRGYNDTNLWSLGVSFLSRVYMTLNVERKTVGFSNLKTG